MSYKRLSIIFAICFIPLLMSLQSCSEKEAPPADTEIAQSVKDKILVDTNIHVTDVSVESRNGVVIIYGTVDNPKQEKMILDLARGVFGVKDVRSRLKVKESMMKQQTPTTEGNKQPSGQGAGQSQTTPATPSMTPSQGSGQGAQGSQVTSPQKGTEVNPKQGTEVAPKQGAEEKPKQGTEVNPSQSTEEKPKQGSDVSAPQTTPSINPNQIKNPGSVPSPQTQSQTQSQTRTYQNSSEETTIHEDSSEPSTAHEESTEPTNETGDSGEQSTDSGE